ncbi:hypothetical protein E2C01_023284 [Portunus trituberculatus]|uniref:Uncharacterized protein n=1 Tax=Portunus trituberculatus TaxID=210409 RepID=A0A5B7E7K5_PORTR|nr:hypothetical protein [Portunus trituberculatus]
MHETKARHSALLTAGRPLPLALHRLHLGSHSNPSAAFVVPVVGAVKGLRSCPAPSPRPAPVLAPTLVLVERRVTPDGAS